MWLLIYTYNRGQICFAILLPHLFSLKQWWQCSRRWRQTASFRSRGLRQLEWHELFFARLLPLYQSSDVDLRTVSIHTNNSDEKGYSYSKKTHEPIINKKTILRYTVDTLDKGRNGSTMAGCLLCRSFFIVLYIRSLLLLLIAIADAAIIVGVFALSLSSLYE